jgi:hypothetical protein
MKRLLRWLDDHTPDWCDICMRMMFRKDAIWTRTTTGKQTCLCQACHKELYSPLEK